MKSDISSLHRNGFRYIKAVSLERPIEDGKAGSYTARITLSTEDGRATLITATDAFAIKIGDLNNMLVPVFECRDVGQQQIEGARYYLTDIEEDLLSLYCREITVEGATG